MSFRAWSFRARPFRAWRTRLRRAAGSIALACGWRRRLFAFSAGACGALALPPLGLMPALALALVPAVWLIDGRVFDASSRRAVVRGCFADGFAFGFGYFLAGLWWLGAAFLVEADQFAWALPLGVLGLPTVLALFPAAGFSLAGFLWTPGPSRVLVFAAALSASEWLRGHLFTGFPWNAFGMALGGNLLSAQFASIVGLYGLTTLALAIFSAPATLADKPFGARAFAPGLLAAAALASLFAFGALRLARGETRFVKDVEIRLMQPNMALDDKFSAKFGREIVERYLALSQLDRPPPDGDAMLLVWPESAFPFILSRSPGAVADIAAALPLGGFLATGAARVAQAPGAPADEAEPERLDRPVFYNSIHVISSAGLIVDTYDKSHLVPFGEYLPFEALLSRLGLKQFVTLPGGFAAGHGRRTLTVPGLPPAAPLICYEAIFPGEALPQERDAPRPGFLLNVTDDGWFGHTLGPGQHFAQARLRAIEEGLPLLRAANTGISAIVDPYGRILESLPLGARGLVVGALPEAAEKTPFARLGALWSALPFAAAAAAGSIMAFLRKRI
ncbi:apolipoprotein N-acyltransferase [Methylocella sp.]|uniref:apolipoprotein N-acyltransferase n=1 Tax=Methylocella sp. TaxID=1978226 RepID=UPI0035B3BE59